MTEIPSSFYVIAGTLIVANIGTVISVFYGVGKMIWWLSKLDARVAAIETHFKKDIDSAHVAIREIRKELTN